MRSPSMNISTGSRSFSPSVCRMDIGITIRPSSSTRRIMPVDLMRVGLSVQFPAAVIFSASFCCFIEYAFLSHALCFVRPPDRGALLCRRVSQCVGCFLTPIIHALSESVNGSAASLTRNLPIVHAWGESVCRAAGVSGSRMPTGSGLPRVGTGRTGQTGLTGQNRNSSVALERRFICESTAGSFSMVISSVRCRRSSRRLSGAGTGFPKSYLRIAPL